MRYERMRMQRLGDASVQSLIANFKDLDTADGLLVDASSVRTIYPNGAVPMAVAVAHARETGVDILVESASEAVRSTAMFAPMTLDKFVRFETPLTHVVWKYRDGPEASKLADLFVDALSHKFMCENGVIDALNWCLYEVMDNVFQHSQAPYGMVMLQFHRSHPQCVISVGDSGIGIQRSMYEGFKGTPDVARVKTPHGAIAFAVEERVTSKIGRNQGNGLFGLRRAVQLNGGRLHIRSGRGTWKWEDDQLEIRADANWRLLDAADHQSTVIDWQLDCTRPVRIEEALGGAVAKPSPLLEGIEQAIGEYRVDVGDLEGALGTRSEGVEVRNLLWNYLSAGAPYIVLDFHDVGVISSSFADEVLGKLAVSIGELEFRKRIVLDRASPTIRALVERAVMLRLAEDNPG